jgi:GlcNAc-PI de-N-acetylase
MPMASNQKYDVIAFGAHPDDLEAVMGGTTVKLVRKGLSVLFLDLCEGEPARHAPRGERHKQAVRAAGILGVERVTLTLQGPADHRYGRSQTTSCPVIAGTPATYGVHDRWRRCPGNRQAAMMKPCCFGLRPKPIIGSAVLVLRRTGHPTDRDPDKPIRLGVFSL